jgi:hypothetical protein
LVGWGCTLGCGDCLLLSMIVAGAMEDRSTSAWRSSAQRGVHLQDCAMVKAENEQDAGTLGKMQEAHDVRHDDLQKNNKQGKTKIRATQSCSTLVSCIALCENGRIRFWNWTDPFETNQTLEQQQACPPAATHATRQATRTIRSLEFIPATEQCCAGVERCWL